MPQPLETAAYLLSETDPARLPPCAAEAAFIGRSNVGKSSLLNALCRRAVAKVSDLPGRTRAINVFSVAHDRWLVDLPGYGFAAGPEAERASWGRMIEGYLKGRASLRVIFALIDAKVGPTRLDIQMVEWLEASGLPWRPVATKADQVKSSRSQAGRREAAHALGVQAEELAWVSAQSGLGLGGLRAEVSAALSS
ncbi:MAG: ribosome biogenesis GTP-binding protein YsxC [Elusimicrobia bacterium]|nr:ribosome biogenesis GTP-binding protein YsxC [Elusimicrobiota bacterium]